MSEQELAHLVEKIVLRVMDRIKVDEQLSALVKNTDPDKSKWARTCSTYRHEEQSTIQPISAAPVSSVEKNVRNLEKKLYTERDILELAKAGQKNLIVSKKTILTPSAKDAANNKGIKISIES